MTVLSKDTNLGKSRFSFQYEKTTKLLKSRNMRIYKPLGTFSARSTIGRASTLGFTWAQRIASFESSSLSTVLVSIFSLSLFYQRRQLSYHRQSFGWLFRLLLLSSFLSALTLPPPMPGSPPCNPPCTWGVVNENPVTCLLEELWCPSVAYTEKPTHLSRQACPCLHIREHVPTPHQAFSPPAPACPS